MNTDILLKSINFKIKNKKLVEQALTHSSYSNEKNLGILENNERLEFLGDAVLKLSCSTFLFNKFLDEREGVLSKLRSILIADSTLNKYALKINLDKYIKIGYHEEKMGGRSRVSIISCAFEALLGALYLETSVDEVYRFLEPLLDEELNQISKNMSKINAKTTLQEYTQKTSKDLPVYVTLNESGKEHDKCFEVAILYHNKEIAKGSGKTKKEAEQNAAYRACVELGVINE